MAQDTDADPTLDKRGPRRAGAGVAGEPEDRRAALLGAAARLFNEAGYEGTSMRHLATAVGILPGSLYHYFKSKDDLLFAVHEQGIAESVARVTVAINKKSDPWDRLEAACAAHLGAILGESDYAAVVIRVLPHRGDPLFDRPAALRDRYEDIFRQLVAELPLPEGVDRKYFRLTLLGALNYAPTWYRPDDSSPRQVASRILRQLRT
jgi:AcrR family transcriptional regulator